MSSLSNITISEDSPDSLDGYERIPSIVLVREVFDIVSNGAGISSLASAPRQLAAPFLKDYDAPPCLPPTPWQTPFDVNSCGFLTAWHNHMPVGKAAIAWPAHELGLLDAPSDVAALWDIRISPDSHRRGIGTRLFHAAESWAARRGAHYLEAETQNVNVPACRFYAKQGCVLVCIERFAYPEFPEEARLCWRKSLGMNRAV